MVILIDNFDSFVYNLARYIGQLQYPRTIIRNNATSIAEISALQPSHIVISAGPCTPNEAGISMAVIDHFAGKIPLLGVCLGHQAIGQVFGGQVVKAKRPMHGMQSEIRHQGEGILQNLPNPLQVARYHSLVVAVQSLPDCLMATAFSKENEIMALQHKTYPIYGVQFHPESVLTEQGYVLLENFLLTRV